MFERYTEKARRVIFFARYEASQSGSPYIEAEHMVLAILRESRDWVLPLDDRTRLAQEISSLLPRNEKISTSVELPLSHSVKRSLAFGAEEAERLKHKHIDAPHLLIGLLREESAASAALNRYGISVDSVRARLLESLAAESAASKTVSGLRSEFEPLLAKLGPEIEPATVFSIQPPSEEILK